MRDVEIATRLIFLQMSQDIWTGKLYKAGLTFDDPATSGFQLRKLAVEVLGGDPEMEWTEYREASQAIEDMEPEDSEIWFQSKSLVESLAARIAATKPSERRRRGAKLTPPQPAQ